MRGSPRSPRARRASASSSAARSRARDGRIAFAGPAADLPAGVDARGADRLRGALDHARPDRLPHASRLRRRPGARIRAAPEGRELRGDRPRRRRHPVDRQGDARGERGRPRRRRPAPPRRADRRGLHHGRDEVRLRPRPRTESRLLRAARRLERRARRRDRHDLSRRTRAAAGSERRPRRPIVDAVCETMLPAIAREGLADAVDAFCEGIAFTPEETARVFAAARTLGLPVKLHADQLSNLHGARLAASLRRALGRPSRIHRRGRRRGDGGGRHGRRAAAGRLLLPARDAGAAGRRLPPASACRIALATDCNPGTSPLTSLLLAMNMGATLFRLTVEECLAGVTREAARALGRRERDRHARGRQVVRPRDLGHRAAGRARLPHRLQPAPRPRLEGPMTAAVTLVPGAVSLAALARDLSRRGRRASTRRAARRVEAGARGRSPRSSPRASRSTASTPASESSRACASRAAISPRCSATSCSRTRPASASRCPCRVVRLVDGAEAREPRAGRLGRALVDGRRISPPASTRASCRSCPAKGSVGASGDLAPLAHMTAALMGVGEFVVARRARARRRAPCATPA